MTIARVDRKSQSLRVEGFILFYTTVMQFLYYMFAEKEKRIYVYNVRLGSGAVVIDLLFEESILDLLLVYTRCTDPFIG